MILTFLMRYIAKLNVRIKSNRYIEKNEEERMNKLKDIVNSTFGGFY